MGRIIEDIKWDSQEETAEIIRLSKEYAKCDILKEVFVDRVCQIFNATFEAGRAYERSRRNITYNVSPDKDKLKKNHIKKQIVSIRLNVEQLLKKYTLEHLKFLTFTFIDDLQFTNVVDWKESQRRFNSYSTNVIRSLFDDYIVILEPQQSGRIHYNLLVVCKRNVHALVSSLKNSAKRYGFDHIELLPVRTNSEAVDLCVGAYLAGGNAIDFLGSDSKRFRGRRIRFSQDWKVTNFSRYFRTSSIGGVI
jgi:hypothetical protein